MFALLVCLLAAQPKPISPAAHGFWYELIRMGEGLREQERYAEAQSVFERARSLSDSFAPDDPRRGVTLNHLGALCIARGDYRQAITLLQKALKTYNPDNPDPSIAEVMSNLGTCLRRVGRTTEAAVYYERALALERIAYGPSDERVAVTIHGLAWIAVDEARYADAMRGLQQAREILERKNNTTGMSTVAASIAHVYSRLGDYKRAEAMYRRAIHLRRQQPTHNQGDLARVLGSLAVVMMELGKHSKAEPTLREAIEMMQKSRGPEHPDIAALQLSLGALLLETERHAEAEPMVRRAIGITDKAKGPHSTDALAARQTLASILQATNRQADAEQLLLHIIRIREQVQSADHPDCVRSLQNLAMLYVRQQRYVEAEPLYQRAIAIAEARLGPKHLDLAIVTGSYAELLKATGRRKEGNAMQKRAAAIASESGNTDLTGFTVDFRRLRK